MRRRRWMLVMAVTVAALTTPLAADGGFDRAIDALLPRVVKLYGVGLSTQAGYGSGVIVSPDGMVLTVFSLLIDAKRLRAVTADGTTYEAEVIHRDVGKQLALLRLKSEAEISLNLPYFDVDCGPPLLDSDAADCGSLIGPGDWIVAAGNPFKVADGAEPVSLAHGVVSTRTRLDASRRVRDFPYRGEVLVIDAITSNPGAPGSALVNLDGEFVGMIGRVVMSNLTHTHFNYAVPRDVLAQYVEEAKKSEDSPTSSLARLDSLLQTGEEEAGVDLGIRITRTAYKSLPPMIERVQWGSPADKAGLRKDDIILSVNGRNVPDLEEYDRRIVSLVEGEPINLVVRRGERILSFRIETETMDQ